MKKVLLRFFLFSIVMMIIVSVSTSYSAKIHFKNGNIIRGKIISIDDAFVTIEEQFLGILKISRQKIIIIEPFREEKKVKKKRIELEILKQEDPYYSDYPTKKRRKKLINIYLAGGFSNINGGDLNGMIRDWNEAYEDYDAYFPTASFSADWKQLKWMHNLKGEILFNLSPSFSIGLGIEYLTKKNKGILTFDYEDTGRVYETGYYYDVVFEENDHWEPEHKLTAIPVTVNTYFFIPVTSKAELFITGGVGYYFGKLKYNTPYQYDWDLQADYYLDDGTYLFSLEYDNYSEEGTYTYEAECKKIGFHAGIGIDIMLYSNISLVVEGNYRYVNFKDWNGNGKEEWSWYEEWKWSDELDIYYDSDSGSESWKEKIWYWEYDDSDTGERYKRIFLLDEKPEADAERKNVRQAKINLNGFSLRVGIKISF